jgi:hypothetical protein
MSSDKLHEDLMTSLYGILPSGGTLARRTSLFEPHVIENRVYKNENLSLDGYIFRNCAIIDCVLYTEKGNFQIEDCHFARCVATFGGNALRIVKYSALMLSTWEQLIAEFRPAVEADGGVTIK